VEPRGGDWASGRERPAEGWGELKRTLLALASPEDAAPDPVANALITVSAALLVMGLGVLPVVISTGSAALGWGWVVAAVILLQVYLRVLFAALRMIGDLRRGGL
jgi:hypothetical protein